MSQSKYWKTPLKSTSREEILDIGLEECVWDLGCLRFPEPPSRDLVRLNTPRVHRSGVSYEKNQVKDFCFLFLVFLAIWSGRFLCHYFDVIRTYIYRGLGVSHPRVSPNDTSRPHPTHDSETDVVRTGVK